MVLVDTSVLVSALKGITNKQVDKLSDIIEMGIPWGLNLYIYQEILQGAKDTKEFNNLKKYFETQRFYYLKNGKISFENASEIYFKCRKAGFTISSTIDCLVAQTAIENDLYLLHDDSDFDYIQKTINILKVY